MQGLAHYADNSPSPPPVAGPSRHRNDPTSNTVRHDASSSKSHQQHPRHRVRSPQSRQSPPPKRRKASTGTVDENLTHTAQSSLQTSELASEPVAIDEKKVEASTKGHSGVPGEGMTEEELFRTVTRPHPIEGLDDWGIPPEVDPGQCDPKLTSKVAQFLDLKYKRGQHINTSLLASTSFSNPHIYSKLVEFVDLDERASSFPQGGWLTREGLESLIPRYGPKALGEEQKRKQEEVRKAQEPGKRRTIDFAPSKQRESDRDRDRDRMRGREGENERYRQRGDDRDRYRDYDKSRGKERDRREADREKDRRDRRHQDRPEGGWDERDMRRDKREWDRRHR